MTPDPLTSHDWKIDFFFAFDKELHNAITKFPSPNGTLAALTEETGEVAKACLDESRERVWKECVQVAVMAFRIAVEGDPTLNEIRISKGLKPMGLLK